MSLSSVSIFHMFGIAMPLGPSTSIFSKGSLQIFYGLLVSAWFLKTHIKASTIETLVVVQNLNCKHTATDQTCYSLK